MTFPRGVYPGQSSAQRMVELGKLGNIQELLAQQLADGGPPPGMIEGVGVTDPITEGIINGQTLKPINTPTQPSEGYGTPGWQGDNPNAPPAGTPILPNATSAPPVSRAPIASPGGSPISSAGIGAQGSQQVLGAQAGGSQAPSTQAAAIQQAAATSAASSGLASARKKRVLTPEEFLRNRMPFMPTQ